MIRVFAGRDIRESRGWVVFAESLFANTKERVSLAPLSGEQLDGTNAFTYARFLVPELCDYKGWAIFVDGSDMMLRADIAELYDLRDESKAVQVVQHDYQTKYKRKYVGTQMEADNGSYPRKNWSSVVLWNCGHPANGMVTEKFIKQYGYEMHRFFWLERDEIGALPMGWNHLVREQKADPAAKLVHFTLGIPAFERYAEDEFSDEWRYYHARANMVAA